MTMGWCKLCTPATKITTLRTRYWDSWHHRWAARPTVEKATRKGPPAEEWIHLEPGPFDHEANPGAKKPTRKTAGPKRRRR